MRQIILDTETTGLETSLGHRVIEIAAVEMVNRRFTGNHFHQYLNPDREIDAGAQQVHGISLDFLQDKPRFREIMSDFLNYIDGGELIIHNAPFDVGFLNHELGLEGMNPVLSYCGGVVDTLKLAKELHPGQKNNLDALCKRYGVDNSGRTLHGALLDAELLAEVYLAMTRGQESLVMDVDTITTQDNVVKMPSGPLLIQKALSDELSQHEHQLAAIDKESKGQCLWLLSKD